MDCDVIKSNISTVMVISATDSGGSAGMQADLRVCGALNVVPTSVVTAVTAQNSLKVLDTMSIPEHLVKNQLEAAWHQNVPGAVKIGLLPTDGIIVTITEELNRLQAPNIICDPILGATAGSLLHSGSRQWKEKLLNNLCSHVTLLTPNLPELSFLTEMPVETPEQIMAAAKFLITRFGVENVLVKGGHNTQPDACVDYLLLGNEDKTVAFTSQKISTCNLRGTGCTLSTAIACYLSRGFELSEAVVKAEAYLQNAITSARDDKYNSGSGPVNHFANLY